MDKWSDYGDEETQEDFRHLSHFDMGGVEMKPEVLPLETIIEEDSVIKESPPQGTNKVAEATSEKSKPTAKAKSPKGKAREAQRKRSSDKFTRRNSPPKGIKYPSPARKYPEMTEAERKLAESDAYIRQIQRREVKK